MKSLSVQHLRNQDPSVSVVIPTRNEARNLELVLPLLLPAYEVIVVDAGSVDGTPDVVRRIRPTARIINQNGIGKGNAFLCGFRVAVGDIIVTLDADGSADPLEIPRFVAGLLDGADYAKGSRFLVSGGVRGGSDDITPLRTLGNAGLSTVSNALFRTRFSDLCYGYNAFWRDVLPAFELPDERVRPHPDQMRWGEGFEIEALLSCRAVAAGMRIVEIPSVERERIHGTTNLRTFTDGARVLRTLLVEYRLARARRRRPRGASLPAGPPSVPWAADGATPEPVTEPSWFPMLPALPDQPAALRREPDVGSATS